MKISDLPVATFDPYDDNCLAVVALKFINNVLYHRTVFERDQEMYQSDWTPVRAERDEE